MSTEKVTNTNTSDNKNVSVAQSLKNKDQWICWNIEEKDGRETKVPIDPHGSGYADTTDSDTWTSYEDAVEYKEKADCDGIGFVFTQAGWVVGVDLDDCRDPDTGQLEDWADDVVNTLDSYTEISPSGEGLHIYVEGTLRGLENNRKDELENVDGDGHLEMYEESRFFTFSENHLRGTKTTVENRQNEIEEVGEKYLEDDEKYPQKDFDPDDVQLDLSDEEILEKAKSAENGDEFERLWDGDLSGHDGDHSRADLALLNKLAFWTACDYDQMERLFSNSGLSREKWENREDYRERSINKAIQSCSEVYDPDSGSDEDYDYACEKGILAVDDITVHEGGYHRVQERTTKEGETYFDYDLLTSYTIEVQSIMFDEHGNKKLDLKLIADDGREEVEVQVEPQILGDKPKYNRKVETGVGTYNKCSSRDLADIRSIVTKQAREVGVKEGADFIGMYDGNQLVTPNGVLTAGDTEPSYKYISQNSEIEAQWSIDDLDYDKETAQRVLELLPQTRRDSEIIPVLGWYLSTPYANMIRDKEGQFMSIMADGERETGKSAIFGLMQKMMGLIQDGELSVDSSKFNLLKYFSATNTVPIWFDEYKPTDYADYEMKRFKKIFRESTRGGYANRGTRDQEQKRYAVKAPVALTGEQKVRGSAENSRIVPIKFDHPNDTHEEYWSKLTGENDPEQDGYDVSHLCKAMYEFILQQDRDEARDGWDGALKRIQTLIEEESIRVSNRATTALTQIFYGWKVYYGIANYIGADLSEIPSEEEVIEAITMQAKEMEIDQRESDLEVFIQLMSDARRKGYIKLDEDYTIVNQGSEDEELVIDIRRVHQAVTTMVNERGLNSYQLLDDHDVYRDRCRTDTEDYVNDTSKRVNTSFNRGVALDVDTLSTLEDFSISVFY